MGDDRAGSVGPRLAGMMFLQYFGIGAWIVPLGRYLPAAPAAGGLGFDPADVSLIYSAWPVAGMTTPLLVAPLADRYVSAEKLLGVLQLAMAGFFALAGWWCGQPEAVNNPWPLFGIMLGYSACLLPTLSLTNVIAMRNLPDPTARFARVRLVGTFGWIVAGYAVSWAIVPMSPQPFFLAAVVAVVQGVSSFWLPNTPPMGRGRPVRDVIGLSALAMFRDRAFVGFAVATLVGNMLNQFYVLNANRYLAEGGLPRSEAWLTLAQWCEMACMAAVPALVGRFGLRPVMLAGLAGWTVRNAVLAAGSLPVAVAVAVPLHGLSYTFFSVVGSLFVDREAPPHLRASAQALVTFLSSGPAVLAGYWLASAAGRHYTTPAGIDWAGVWLVPTVGILVAFAAFLALFREPPAKTPPNEDAPDAAELREASAPGR